MNTIKTHKELEIRTESDKAIALSICLELSEASGILIEGLQEVSIKFNRALVSNFGNELLLGVLAGDHDSRLSSKKTPFRQELACLLLHKFSHPMVALHRYMVSIEEEGDKVEEVKALKEVLKEADVFVTKISEYLMED